MFGLEHETLRITVQYNVPSDTVLRSNYYYKQVLVIVDCMGHGVHREAFHINCLDSDLIASTNRCLLLGTTRT